MPIDSYTDVNFYFPITGGKINWLKNGKDSFNACKNASKIILQYASINGVARYDNTMKGAII
ncbi:hypothetical protein [Sphingobacterium rhinopitheci]|uniref:hypothetical protein n=1 Tax=Sphingobacterium rhinopitheci TaxID=2781960 RepID=UPI001F524EC8|nr:hypothetical protein [Sphingobacterium rhinopitheci]MCI0921156.1 hypothetical protein [Sphingobacterium rhinopitheci]